MNRKTYIPAITLHQPYASLLVLGKKPHETRGWATGHRGPMAIHASKQPVAKMLAQLPAEVVQHFQALLGSLPLAELPTGAVVGMGKLVACHRITPAFAERVYPAARLTGDYTLSRYAWEFEGIVMFEKPVPARGRQGLWHWESEENAP